ncbi:hypothetical protein OG946_20235 [Streptomyces sp. NBC_01808]|uniref:zinc finger domain-containing protein n=1 Tax=Streptomyces sp. NBC_01808 TaxID=2975947 RepID=UPI002DDBC12B|nr:hypothetical protein [Streptomyces sp. NBC_01808]WSA39485.1 hypothetical protein OG946_20235 [Streptomyces sp. NBC_01808]
METSFTTEQAPEWRTLKGVTTPFRIHTNSDGHPLGRKDTPGDETMTIVDMELRGSVRYGTTADGRKVILWGVATRYWVTTGAGEEPTNDEQPAAPHSGREVTIPGALADFLAGTNLATGADDHDPASKATREALDAGRRGRGRTLIIRPTIDVLHVISEYAETLLAPGFEATPAERRAAKLWIERAGHAAKPAPAALATERTEDTPSLEDLATTVTCPTCHVPAGARCTTRTGKPARESHGRRFEAVEQAAGITAHRATADREAQARGDRAPSLDRKAEQALLTAYAARINARAQLDDEQRLAAELVTEAEAADGTWRGEWIGQQPADDGAVFTVEPDADQGALFDDRVAALDADIKQGHAEADQLADEVAAWGAEVDAVTAPAETVAPEVTRASVDAYLARTYPALFAPEQPRPIELEPALMWSVSHRVVIRGEWQGLIMCGLGRREAEDRASVLRYTGSKAVEVAPCEHGPHAHRDARRAARCDGCGYVVPRGEQWHDACRPRPRLTPLEHRRLAEERDAGWARAIEASARVTEQGGEPPF